MKLEVLTDNERAQVMVFQRMRYCHPRDVLDLIAALTDRLAAAEEVVDRLVGTRMTYGDDIKAAEEYRTRFPKATDTLKEGM